MDAGVVVRLCKKKTLEELPTVTPYRDLVGFMLALAMLIVVIAGFFLWS
jgi:hypothetical protein